MLLVIRIGLLNLLRNPRRNVLTMSTVIAAVTVLILGKGFVGGMKENIIRAQIDAISGHVALQPADYPEDPLTHPLENLLTLTPRHEALLDDVSEAWTQRLLFVPNLFFSGDSMPVLGIAIDPANDPQVFPRDDWRVQGKIPSEAGDGILITSGTASILEIDVGDTIALKTRTTQGAINALRLPVAGIVATGSPLIDDGSVFITWDLSESLVRNSNATSHVLVRLKDRNDAVAVADRLQESLGGMVQARPWQQETADLIALQETREKMLDILVFAILIMAAAGISNTIMMAAYERIREIGTLLGLGMTRQQVIALFLVEGAVIGLVGGTIGALLGGTIVYRGMRDGIDISGAIEPMGAAGGSLPFSTMLYLDFSPTMVGIGLAFGILVAVAASVYPAIMASRLVPAVALRAR